MSLFIDIKYVHLISPYLKLFKQVGDNNWNFRCPICGDSQKSQSKTRGYFYEYEQSGKINFRCHNCQASMSLSNFIKKFDLTLHKKYSFEKFSKGKSKQNPNKEIDLKKFKKNKEKTDIQSCVPLSVLPESHPARLYTTSRKIPKDQLANLYYAKDFRKFVTTEINKTKYKDIPKEHRIVIPVYNEFGSLIGCQGRALEAESMRYITARKDSETLIFGLERWNKRETTYVVEGPFDSLFLPNTLAAMNSDLGSVIEKLQNETGIKPERIVYIFDNEPRNKEIIRLLGECINRNFDVVIWPKSIKEKDINDMVLAGHDVDKIIQENTFSSIQAKIKFNDWRKF